MRPVEIQIHQVSGQLGLNITQPNINLKITAPDIQMKTTPANLELTIEPPEIFIDSREAFDSMGLQGTYSYANSLAQEAKQAAVQGIERRVSIMRQMEDPQSGSVGQVVAAASQPPEKEVVIGLSPSVRPSISAKLGTVKGTYTPARIDATVHEGKIVNNFTWGRVDIYMEREPSIDIKT
ncbi:DUF6470 family protein [Pelosinus propionicus]|uniref:YviE n=1 Tax=Pelosinus propionicus DSM 13327 TaxID=1123291 RepID=A0A1I4QD52_9FIRM|nr:DUF6470 family protein [Pelosinus propionicus]SFM37957.1 hypothetical protein SAMN04490355_10954 [Pelosinus propionicus DSM 13327]